MTKNQTRMIDVINRLVQASTLSKGGADQLLVDDRSLGMACRKCCEQMIGVLQRLAGLLIESIIEGCHSPSLSSEASKIRANYKGVLIWDI